MASDAAPDSPAEARQALGRAIRSARRVAGLSQEQLAAEVGIGTSTLRQWESGGAQGPSLYRVLLLFNACGSSLDALEETFTTCTGRD